MIDFNNLPGVELRKFCGIPVDKVDGVVIACRNEVIGFATLEYDDEVIELDVCQAHYDELDKARASVLD